MKKAKPQIKVTPLMRKCLESIPEGEPLTISKIQRHLQVSFTKACELAKLLSDAGLVESNVGKLSIWMEDS